MARSWERSVRGALVKPAEPPAARLRRPPRRKRREASIEDSCRDLAHALGWRSRKLNGLGFRDWPDRLFFPPPRKRSARHFFVEFKRPGEEPTESQDTMHKDLRSRGQKVHVCTTKEEFVEALKENS